MVKDDIKKCMIRKEKPLTNIERSQLSSSNAFNSSSPTSFFFNVTLRCWPSAFCLICLCHLPDNSHTSGKSCPGASACAHVCTHSTVKSTCTFVQDQLKSLAPFSNCSLEWYWIWHREGFALSGNEWSLLQMNITIEFFLFDGTTWHQGQSCSQLMGYGKPLWSSSEV